jgi:4-hydroxybenzoate polyprenyltransferase
MPVGAGWGGHPLNTLRAQLKTFLMRDLINRIKVYGELIKFSHTVFALPFALVAVLMAQRQHSVRWATLGWILVAMASARSAAMGFNRLVDYEYDRRNPRTAARPLTAGLIGKGSVLWFILLSSLLFLFSAAILGKWCFVLSLPVLSVLFFYSYSKRFTSFSHLILGFAIGLAPLGAWVAVAGQLDLSILPLSLALMTYIAGFDILYACQDIEFDQRARLFSLPANWGVERALNISSLLHFVTLTSLSSLYFIFSLGPVYVIFLLLVTILLFVEHRMVRPGHLDHINVAFFHLNSVISVSLFLAVWVDNWIFWR